MPVIAFKYFITYVLARILTCLIEQIRIYPNNFAVVFAHLDSCVYTNLPIDGLTNFDTYVLMLIHNCAIEQMRIKNTSTVIFDNFTKIKLYL